VDLLHFLKHLGGKVFLKSEIYTSNNNYHEQSILGFSVVLVGVIYCYDLCGAIEVLIPK